MGTGRGPCFKEAPNSSKKKKKKEQKLAEEECMASTMLVCMEVAELKRQDKLSGSWGSAF